MDITLPVGSWVHASGNDYVTWAMPDHTESLPHIVIFKRRPQSGDYTRYQVKYVRAQKNATTGEVKNRILQFDVQNVAWQDSTDVDEMTVNFQAIAADADFWPMVNTKGQLPYS